MATLAPTLRRLFLEVDLNWPNRSHRLDGWIGDAAHQARESDHNPDSRGIVHAIDIDRNWIDTLFVVEQCISENRPTEYVIYNRQIWSRTRDFKPRAYTGENPHTDHIHVSIRYGATYEADTWAWGVAPGGPNVGQVPRPGPSDDMSVWDGLVRAAGDYSNLQAVGLRGATQIMRSLMG